MSISMHTTVSHSTYIDLSITTLNADNSIKDTSKTIVVIKEKELKSFDILSVSFKDYHRTDVVNLGFIGPGKVKNTKCEVSELNPYPHPRSINHIANRVANFAEKYIKDGSFCYNVTFDFTPRDLVCKGPRDTASPEAAISIKKLRGALMNLDDLTVDRTIDITAKSFKIKPEELVRYDIESIEEFVASIGSAENPIKANAIFKS